MCKVYWELGALRAEVRVATLSVWGGHCAGTPVEGDMGLETSPAWFTSLAPSTLQLMGCFLPTCAQGPSEPLI